MSEPDSGPVTRVLVIEDNPIDVRLLRYAFSFQSSWRVEFSVLEDGEKAFAYLEDCERNQHKIPSFVILDLNLPKRDGAEVLQCIRNSSVLRRMPVAILSSSPLDVIQGRMSRANVTADCYLVKPMNVDEFIGLGRELRECYEKAAGGISRAREA